MDNAKILTKEDLTKLKRGEVVWRESHIVMDCGQYGEVDGYNILPMLVSISGENGLLGYIDDDSEVVIELNNLPDGEYYWSKEPEPGQIKTGLPIEEALEIYNKYEKEMLRG